LLFLGVGAVAAAYLPWGDPPGGPQEPSGFLSYWAHWDGAWYTEIATEGYDVHAPASTAFFPVFPMILRVGASLGGGPALWGVLISLVATLFALYFLYRIAEKFRGRETARAATLAFAFFPTAFFLNAPFTEALFVASAAGSLWAAYVRRDMLLAGLLGALAAATRNSGVLLLIPLLYEWLRDRHEFGWRGLWEMALVPTGLLGYMAFLWTRFGDPMVFAQAQSDYWGRGLTNPLTTLEEAWTSAGESMSYLFDLAPLFLDSSASPTLELCGTCASGAVNIAFFIFFLVLMGIGFAVLPPGLSVFSFVVMLLHILTPSPLIPLLGLPRFVLEAFPLFLALGLLLARSRLSLGAWLLISGVLGMALTTLFVTWRWVA
jgi:dolichyl-phosphate-mannose-protein mannosyltransferase